MLYQIQESMKTAEQEIDDVKQHQKVNFEDFIRGGVPSRNEEQNQLIKELKEFRQRIQDMNDDMDDMNSPLHELKTKYIEYEIQESANLANFDFGYLRERVAAAETALQKNKACASQMDGNASDENEDFLVESMKTEIPENLKQLKHLTKEIKVMEDLVKQIQKKKDAKKIQTVK